MPVCLDTTFLVDLLAGKPRAVEFARLVEEQCLVSAVSFYELLSSPMGQERLARVASFAEDYAVIPADYEVCSLAAAIQARLRGLGEPIPVLDALIAATAILGGAPLVTSDRHFDRIPEDFRLAMRAY